MKLAKSQIMPHLFTDEHKKVPNFNQRQFANYVAGDVTWVRYFEPVRNIGNKIMLYKHCIQHVVAKKNNDHKEVLYAIFFSCAGIVI